MHQKSNRLFIGLRLAMSAATAALFLSIPTLLGTRPGAGLARGSAGSPYVCSRRGRPASLASPPWQRRLVMPGLSRPASRSGAERGRDFARFVDRPGSSTK